MRLEPVFLAATRSAQPAPRPSRRAFLLAGCWFTGGVLVGGACGVSIATAAKDDAGAPQTTGDPELDRLRRLATDASVTELVDNWVDFLEATSNSYFQDEVLWKGVVRIADAVLIDEKLKDRRILGKLLLQMLEKGKPPAALNAESRMAPLRELNQKLSR